MPSNATGSTPGQLARIGEAPDGPPLALTYELARRIEANRETKPLQELVQDSRPTTSPRSREATEEAETPSLGAVPAYPSDIAPRGRPYARRGGRDAGSSTGAARRVGAGGAQDPPSGRVGDPGHADLGRAGSPLDRERRPVRCREESGATAGLCPAPRVGPFAA